METTACAVHQPVQHLDVVDGSGEVDGLAPMPTNIKDQLPGLAAMLQYLATQIGREAVQLQLKASIDLRKAYDADDYRAVNAIYRRGHGWVDCQEAGYCVGVPKQAMQTFALKHRRSQA
jgi:hypothetical protein